MCDLAESVISLRLASSRPANCSRSPWGMSVPKTICFSPTKSITCGSSTSSTSVLKAYTLRLLGEIAAQKDSLDVGEAEDHYRQALALAEELGMRPLIAHCHVGLGKLYRRSGNLPLAKEHLHKGIALMREMEMGLWLESAEAGLKELG